MPRQFRNRSVRTEMKTLECLRCHRQVRLDEYKEHLTKCGLEKPASPVADMGTQTPASV